MQQTVEHVAIGQAGQAVVRGKVFDPLIRFGLLVRTVEIIQCEGDIVGDALQQIHRSRRERALFSRTKQQDADRLSAIKKGKRR